MLRQRVHYYCFLQTVFQMVADQLQCLVISIYNSSCSSIGQRNLLLHIYLHGIQLFYWLINDADRVLANHHVVFSYPFRHVVHLILKLIQLMDQSLCLLLESYGFKIKSLLNTLQRLHFMCFMLYSFINTRHTHHWLIIVTVQV